MWLGWGRAFTTKAKQGASKLVILSYKYVLSVYHLVMSLKNVDGSFYMILCDCIPHNYISHAEYGRFFGVFFYIHDAVG